MIGRTWRFERLPAVDRFIADLPDVARCQIEEDIKKLCRYTDRATEPLIKHIKGPIFELRTKVQGYGLYRIFYYRRDQSSVVGFDAYKKDKKRIPRSVRDRVYARYEELTGRKP